jgi:hypothetical protein
VSAATESVATVSTAAVSTAVESAADSDLEPPHDTVAKANVNATNVSANNFFIFIYFGY